MKNENRLKLKKLQKNLQMINRIFSLKFQRNLSALIIKVIPSSKRWPNQQRPLNLNQLKLPNSRILKTLNFSQIALFLHLKFYHVKRKSIESQFQNYQKESKDNSFLKRKPFSQCNSDLSSNCQNGSSKSSRTLEYLQPSLKKLATFSGSFITSA